MDDEEEDGDAYVSEDYIEKVKSGLGNIVPEDFALAKVNIPVDAVDGEEVAVILTGVSKGGRLLEAAMTEIDLSEPKGPGRIKKMFGEKENNDEEDA